MSGIQITRKFKISIIFTLFYVIILDATQFSVVKNMRSYNGATSQILAHMRARSRLECTTQCGAHEGCVFVNYRKPECLLYAMHADVGFVEEKGWSVSCK